jgi:hypothetical protein
MSAWHWSPLEIKLILRCYVEPEPHIENIEAPAMQDALQRFLNEGLLSYPSYKTTEKGRALVNAICNTPLPTQVWLDALGNQLDAR